MKSVTKWVLSIPGIVFKILTPRHLCENPEWTVRETSQPRTRYLRNILVGPNERGGVLTEYLWQGQGLTEWFPTQINGHQNLLALGIQTRGRSGVKGGKPWKRAQCGVGFGAGGLKQFAFSWFVLVF